MALLFSTPYSRLLMFPPAATANRHPHQCHYLDHYHSHTSSPSSPPFGRRRCRRLPLRLLFVAPRFSAAAVFSGHSVNGCKAPLPCVICSPVSSQFRNPFGLRHFQSLAAPHLTHDPDPQHQLSLPLTTRHGASPDGGLDVASSLISGRRDFTASLAAICIRGPPPCQQHHPLCRCHAHSPRV
jgi:hypothetical protein